MKRSQRPIEYSDLTHIGTITLAAFCLLSLMQTGCVEPARQDVRSERTVIQNVDEKKQKQINELQKNKLNKTVKTDPQEPVKKQQGDIKQEESKKQEEAKQPVPEKKQEKSKAGSAIDAAIEIQKEKPVTSGHEEPVVEPAEPHEALVPLIKENWVRLHPGYEVWFDMQEKQVIVGGRVSLQEGLLEMFACPMHTKEHESVIATVSNAQIVHAGLLAVGAMKGNPTQWDPEFKPASGPTCSVTVVWTEEGEEKRMRAQEMVLDGSTGEALEMDWVFCGSNVWQNPEDASQVEYQADWGELICVSNFSSAMMDLPIQSSDAAGSHRFGANPKTVPALGTPVLLIIKPDLTTNPGSEAESKIGTEERESAAVEKALKDADAKAKDKQLKPSATEAKPIKLPEDQRNERFDRKRDPESKEKSGGDGQ